MIGGRRSAEPVIGGFAPDRLGFFYNPTLLTGVEQDGDLTQGAVFRLVVTVQTFSSEEEALQPVRVLAITRVIGPCRSQ